MSDLERKFVEGEGWQTVESGGSQPGLRTAQTLVSWADVDARDPAVGVVLATLAADELLQLLTVSLDVPMAGTDAATASACVSYPALTVAGGPTTAVTNASPVAGNYGFPAGAGPVYGAFALTADKTMAADLTGGAFTATLLILGGS